MLRQPLPTVPAREAQGRLSQRAQDLLVVRAQLLGPIPAAGMFCAGEIGPVGGQSFLHGFTASVALFA